MTFEYPAEWPMITGGFYARHYLWEEAVLGSGTWTTGCIQYLDPAGNATGETCGSQTFDPAPGGVLVEMFTSDNPAGFHATAPPEIAGHLDGLPYTAEAAGTRTIWSVFNIPNSPPLEVVAVFGDGASADVRAQMDALVASIRLSH